MRYLKLKKIVLAAVTAVLFCTAAAVFCTPALGADEISSISVALIDSTLDRSDLKTGYLFNESTQSYRSYSYYDVYDLNNIKLTVRYESGGMAIYSGNGIARFSSQTMNAFSISDNQKETAWTVGTHTVTYTLGAYSAQADYTVVSDTIASVTVKPMYEIAPVFELDGQRGAAAASDGSIYQRFVYDLGKYDYNITLTYANGQKVTCTNSNLYALTGYKAEFSQPDGVLSPGSYTGYCTIGGATGTFCFKIKENDVKSVELYMSDNADVLLCPEDGFYTTSSSGVSYFRYIYDHSKIRAKVTYTSGTTSDYSIGELNAALHSRLELFDTQDVSPWTLGTVEVKGRIKGIDCVLPLSLGMGSVKLSTAARSTTAITLSWERNMFADGYELEQYINGKWTVIKVIDSDSTTSYRISGLAAGTAYHFRIRAYIDGGRVYSPYSTLNTMTSPNGITELASGTITSDSVGISWKKSSTADGYIIEYMNNGTWTRAAKISSAAAVSYTLSGLNASTQYLIRVCAFKNNGSEEVCSTYSVITALTNPSKVSGFAVSGRLTSSLTLSWTQNNSADGYILEKYDGTKWVRIAKLTSNSATSYSISGLTASTVYKLRMRTYKMNGSTALYSDYTGTLSAMTSPTAVTGLALTGRTSTSLSLKWNQNTTADGYIIERYNGSAWVSVAKISGNATTTCQVTGLACGTLHSLRMRAYKMSGTTAVYSTYTATLSAYTNPSDITGLTLGGRASDALRLNWNKNTSADGYIIEKYDGTKWVRVAKITNNATTTYRVTGLAAGTAYKFRIRAYKMSGKTALYSGYSATLAVRTNPSKVSGVKIGGRASTALRLNWSKNTSADGYIIEIYKNGKWVRAAKLTSNAATTYRLSGLAKNTTYSIRIKAYKMSGKTALYSGYTTVSAKTLS